MKWIFFLGCVYFNYHSISILSQPLESHLFSSGERLTYRISYGWITIGKAEVTHDYPVRADTFQVEVMAYTTGIVSWIAPLYDFFCTTINKKTLLPVSAFTDRKEGKDLRKERNYFDYERDSAHMIIFKGEEITQERIVAINDSVYDMVSTYTYLRTREYTQMEPDDSLMMKVYYEGKQYNFGIEYIGKIDVSTILGNREVNALYILMPISGTFPRKHMVKVWVSNDEARIPVLMEAQMKFGKARVELVERSEGKGL